VSFEHGAIGPGKDCAYENAYLKAVLGVPVSMEGKTAASAHFSHVGNVALAWADLWSNESVQDVRLLSGGAPAVFAEMLAYDCRLVNEAIRRGEAARLQEWLAASDAPLDPQAWVLAPACVGRVAEALRGAAGPYARGVAAARAAAEQLAGARASGLLTLAPREAEWLDRLRRTLDALPEDEAAFIAARLPERRDRFLPSEYGIG
jgi:methanol--5-hydroxybenzimidazolylcobamide Co-methyltransferase